MNTVLLMGVGGSLLIAAAMIFRRLFSQKLPQYVFVLLWLIVLARLLLPLSIPVKWALPADKLSQRSEIQQTEIRDAAVSQPEYGISQVKSLPLKMELAAGLFTKYLLLTVWLSGAAVTAARFLIPHFQWMKRYRASLPVTAVVSQQKPSLRYRKIEIRQSELIYCPLTYGIIRPVILLPVKQSWENEKELSLILTHEWIHIKRLDLAVKYAACAAVCIYWFNPLVWIMFRLLDRDLELSCDESVIRSTGSRAKKEYALLLIRQAEKQNAAIPAGACFSRRSELEERIESIMKTKHCSSKVWIPAVAMMLCMMTTFTVSASGTNTEPPSQGTKTAAIAAVSAEASEAHEKTADAANPMVTTVTGEEIAKLAQKYLGAQYEYAGTNLSNGVDSSGFVRAVYGEGGIDLPHGTEELAREGVTVPAESAAPGDVVLYSQTNEDHTSSVNHAAIYLGSGRIIHSSNKKEGVKISEISYRTPYEIRRIIN